MLNILKTKQFAMSFARAPLQQRNFATLILAEHFEGNLNTQIGSSIRAAQDIGDTDVDVMVHGS